MQDKIILLDASRHKREAFTCGKSLLDNYLHRQASQDVKGKLAVCFVLANEQNTIIGYYTLSNTGIEREFVPEDIKKKLPHSYSNLLATLLGRLAVDQNFGGQGYGSILLIDALKRSYEISMSSIGSLAVIVDPIDDEAVNFYKKYGFISLPDARKMFLPMKSIAELFH